MKFFQKLILPALLIAGFSAFAQKPTALWEDFVRAKAEDRTPILPDFSFAGYHFSNKAIPALDGKKRYNVTDFGAKPNDETFDDEGIQRAIHAVEKLGGGIIYFPAGRYLVAPDTVKSKHIRISKSNIVLLGAGSAEGGTEIHQANMRVGGRQFQFRPDNTSQQKITEIAGAVTRESFWVTVKDASALKVGQDVVVRHKSEAFTRQYFAPLELKSQWTRLFGEKGGMQVAEIHTIEKIEGNRVKFINPIHIDIVQVLSATWDLTTFQSLEECGIEAIRFTSNWKAYPEEFVHHKNAIHDNGYQAVGFEYVKNSWVRDCEFHDWNDGIFLRAGYAFTIINTHFRGKKGHASVHARTGYGVLVKGCTFNGAQHHGAGTGYSAVGTVITQSTLGTDQNFDIHSGQPYATLYDNIDGGVFYNLGGPEPGHPHHGRHLVLWNFYHRSAKDQDYNFWDMSRRRNYTIAAPILVGFQSDRKVNFQNAGYNEEQNKSVQPVSLFEAQLSLRLKGKGKSGDKKAF